MYEFRAMAVRYRKRNATLKCRRRSKKYQTKMQTTVILTVASQHGLSLLAFVSFIMWLHSLMIPSPPFLRLCVIHHRRKYINQLVPATVSFSLFFSPSFRGIKYRVLLFQYLMHHLISFPISEGLAMLIHGAWVIFFQIQHGINWLRSGNTDFPRLLSFGVTKRFDTFKHVRAHFLEHSRVAN